MKQETPRHRIERSETPWWWFGQPWSRPQETLDMYDDEEPAGDVALSAEEQQEREDAEWFRAMAP